MRYELDFGTANAGGAPTFSTFVRLDTLAAVTQPTITEIGDGLYYFDFDWTTTTATSIAYKATLNGVELSDTISTADATTTSGSVTPPAASGGRFVSYNTLISRAAVQLGLGTVTDAFASTDPNIIQLREFLTSLGDDLLREYDWRHLVREYTFTTTASQTEQALPGDFFKLIGQTMWNRSARLPGVGPMAPQQRQYLKARLSNAIISVVFMLEDSRLTFPLQPPTGSSIALEYLSSYWVNGSTTTAPGDKYTPTANTDIVLFDPLLVVRGLKCLYMDAKGLPGLETAVELYERTKQEAISRNASAPILSMVRSGKAIDRLISGQNVPITGFGS